MMPSPPSAPDLDLTTFKNKAADSLLTTGSPWRSIELEVDRQSGPAARVAIQDVPPLDRSFALLLSRFKNYSVALQ